MGRTCGIAAVLLATAALAVPAAQAEDATLPPASYDAFFDISLATTAQEKCPGAVVDAEALNDAMFQAINTIAESGHDPAAAVQHLGTAAGLAELGARETALRARYGVAPEGDAALCAAMAGETGARPELARLVSFP